MVEKMITDFGALLAKASAELDKERANKRKISHGLAKGFREILEGKGIKILETGPENSNYFCAKISGIAWGISPFGSNDGWWDKPSDGFRAMVKGLDCRWGVIFFDLRRGKELEKKGLWIEGDVFDDKVLKGQETVDIAKVRRAERSGYAHSFYGGAEFISLVTDGAKSKPKVFLRKSKSTSTEI